MLLVATASFLRKLDHSIQTVLPYVKTLDRVFEEAARTQSVGFGRVGLLSFGVNRAVPLLTRYSTGKFDVVDPMVTLGTLVNIVRSKFGNFDL